MLWAKKNGGGIKGVSDLESGLDVAFFGEGHDNMTSLVHKNTVISTISIVYK